MQSTVNNIPAHDTFIHTTQNISPSPEAELSNITTHCCIWVIRVRHISRVFFAPYYATLASRARYNAERGQLTKHYSCVQIKTNEMGTAYGSYGGEERCIRGFVEETYIKESRRRHRRRWEKSERWAWTGSMWLMIGNRGCTCDYDNKRSISIQSREYFHWLKTCSFAGSILSHGES
jgi:hypothetical protein